MRPRTRGAKKPEFLLTTLIVVATPVWAAVTLVVFSIYGVLAAAVRREVIARPRVIAWMRRSFAATYVVLAGRLAASTR